MDRRSGSSRFGVILLAIDIMMYWVLSTYYYLFGVIDDCGLVVALEDGYLLKFVICNHNKINEFVSGFEKEKTS